MAAADPSLRSLIERARSREATVAERHEAFAELVYRFQDFVFAYACARLRDPALAEDAAQDTFLSAWEGLDQMRDPAAFPAWIRQLARTQCHRRLRGMRLTLVPEDDAVELRAQSDVAAESAARHEATLLHRALASLSPADRLVLSLFYGSERSHAEIASWLQVPVTTISRRLAHARRRLRQKTLDALAGAFRTHRRQTRAHWSLELAARLRPLVDEDGLDVASLSNRLGLDRVPVVRSGAPQLAYVVEDPFTRAPVAYAAAVQTIFAPIYDLQFAIGPEALKHHAGDVLLSQVLSDLAVREAITLRHRTSTRHAAIVRFLTSRGFQVVDRAHHDNDRLVLERLLQPSVIVSPARLNEYVGRYVADAMPDAPFVIERYGDSLVSKTRDMRDVLLASSETEFFTRHHYARGRFERDDAGRISRLVVWEGARELVALRVE